VHESGSGPGAEEESTRIDTRWLFLSLVAGVGTITIALLASAATGWAILADIGVSIGSTIGLAGVLIALERRLERRTAAAVIAAVRPETRPIPISPVSDRDEAFDAFERAVHASPHFGSRRMPPLDDDLSTSRDDPTWSERHFLDDPLHPCAWFSDWWLDAGDSRLRDESWDSWHRRVRLPLVATEIRVRLFALSLYARLATPTTGLRVFHNLTAGSLEMVAVALDAHAARSPYRWREVDTVGWHRLVHLDRQGRYTVPDETRTSTRQLRGAYDRSDAITRRIGVDEDRPWDDVRSMLVEELTPPEDPGYDPCSYDAGLPRDVLRPFGATLRFRATWFRPVVRASARAIDALQLPELRHVDLTRADLMF
jgi:hypothetical protein